jgi:hypothetical protein
MIISPFYVYDLKGFWLGLMCVYIYIYVMPVEIDTIYSYDLGPVSLSFSIYYSGLPSGLHTYTYIYTTSDVEVDIELTLWFSA